MASRDLMKKVINEIGIENIYPKLAATPPKDTPLITAAIDEFSKNLTVIGSKESNIIRVILQHNDPEMAAKVVNTQVDFFQEKHLATYRDPKISDFLNDKFTYYHNALKKSEAESKSFKMKQGAFSAAEQEEILLIQRSKLDAALNETQSTVIALEMKLVSLDQQIKVMAKSNVIFSENEQNRLLQNTNESLLKLKLQEKQLLAKFPQDHPKVVNVQERIQISNLNSYDKCMTSGRS